MLYKINSVLFIILSSLFLVNSLNACIGQDGSAAPIPSYPTLLAALPKQTMRVGENTLVILVDFQNCTSTTTQAQWNNILLTTNTPGTSTRDYYLEVSYGNVSLIGAQENSGTVNNGVVGWYTMPFNHPASTYGTGWQNDYGDSLPGMPYMGVNWKNNWALSQQLAYLACKKADSNVDFTQFSHEHYGSGMPPILGYVYAHVVIVVAGYEGSYYGAGNPYTWRHHWYMPGDGYVSNDLCSCWPINGYMSIGSSVRGFGYSLVGEKTPSGGIIGQGLVAHEIGHDLGLPDLYDTDGSTNGYGNGVGEWCLMAGADWLGTPYATKPGHFSAWCKLDRGWVIPTVVQNTKLLNAQIPAVESVPTIYKLIPYNLPGCQQYFLVENRQKKKFDGALPGEGLLIYHVDEYMIGLYRSANRINTRVGYTDALHYGVDVECQDGFPLGSIDHLDSEASGNRGDANDPWISIPDFDTSSTPNSSVYYGSKSLVKSYVAVRNISASASPMTADLLTIPPGSVFFILPATIDFGDVNVGSFKTDSVVVTNNGDLTLNISSVISDNTYFDVTPGSANIDPALSEKFYITFSPTLSGNQSGNIVFTHNGVTSPDSLPVQGNGINLISGWTLKESIPHPPDLKINKYVKDGGSLTSEQGRIYAFPGNKSWQFYKYTPGAPGIWSQLESIPYGPKETDPLKINKKKVGKGASICAEGDIIYAVKGNNTKEFWAYYIDEEDTIPADTWIQLRSVPTLKALKNGTSILPGRAQDRKIYLLAGGQKIGQPNFFVYDIEGDTAGGSPWDTLTSAPTQDNKKWKDGSCIVLADKKIWALKGGGKHNYLWMYDSVPKTWHLIDSVPMIHPTIAKKKKVKAGAAMTVCEDLIYIIKGGGSGEFWAFNPDDSTWTAKETIPILNNDKKSVPKAGAALTELDDKIWLWKGNNSAEFWCYTPATTKSNLKNQTSNIAGTIITNQSEKTANITPLLQVSPNPFSKTTMVNYIVPIAGNITLNLYDVTGSIIKTITNEYHNTGTYTIHLSNMASGVYFLRYENANSKTEVKLIVQ
jgi:M6 family metalloprotease-like protein